MHCWRRRIGKLSNGQSGASAPSRRNNVHEKSRRSAVPAPAQTAERVLSDRDPAQSLPRAGVDERQLSISAVRGGDGDRLPVESRTGFPARAGTSPSAAGQARGLDTQGAGGESKQGWELVAWRPKAWARAAETFDDGEVEIHPRGLIYLPHERLRVRLNEAFGAGWYKFVPVGDPVLGGYEVIWRYRLAFRDGSEAEAAGHASFIKNN